MDTLYTGLMDEESYEDFLAEKEAKPAMTAKFYYDEYLSRNASPGMRKLAEAFEAFLEEPEPGITQNDTRFLSYDEFKAMSDKDRVKNLDRAKASRKHWKTGA